MVNKQKGIEVQAKGLENYYHDEIKHSGETAETLYEAEKQVTTITALTVTVGHRGCSFSDECYLPTASVYSMCYDDFVDCGTIRELDYLQTSLKLAKPLATYLGFSIDVDKLPDVAKVTLRQELANQATVNDP